MITAEDIFSKLGIGLFSARAIFVYQYAVLPVAICRLQSINWRNVRELLSKSKFLARFALVDCREDLSACYHSSILTYR